MRKRLGCSRPNSVTHPRSSPNFTLPTLPNLDHGPLNPFPCSVIIFIIFPVPTSIVPYPVCPRYPTIPSSVRLIPPSVSYICFLYWFVISVSFICFSYLFHLSVPNRDRPEMGASHFILFTLSSLSISFSISLRFGSLHSRFQNNNFIKLN